MQIKHSMGSFRTQHPFVNVTRKILGPISVIVCPTIQSAEQVFLFQVCFNLLECLKEIANGEYGIAASFVDSIFTVSSLIVLATTNLFVQPSVKSFCSHAQLPRD